MYEDEEDQQEDMSVQPTVEDAIVPFTINPQRIEGEQDNAMIRNEAENPSVIKQLKKKRKGLRMNLTKALSNVSRQLESTPIKDYLEEMLDTLRPKYNTLCKTQNRINELSSDSVLEEEITSHDLYEQDLNNKKKMI